MFDLHDPFVIFAFFLNLVLSEDSIEVSVNLTSIVCVGDANVKEGVLSATPESSCPDVESCVVVCVGGGRVAGFVGDWLQLRFCLHISANSLEERRFHVSYVVVPRVDKSPSHTVHCMS